MKKQDDIEKLNSQIQSILDVQNNMDIDHREVIIDRKYAYDSIGDTKKVQSIEDIENTNSSSNVENTKKIVVNSNSLNNTSDYKKIIIIILVFFMIFFLLLVFFKNFGII